MKISILLSLILLLASKTPSDSFEFQINYIDLKYGGNGKPGWVRAGDMDQDGDLDIVAGGGRALFVYENDGSAGGWRRYGNLDPTEEIGANGAQLFDVDRDGDLDVVSARYYSEIGWWENPGGTLSDKKWKFHSIFGENWFLHDLIRVDLDGDGISEEFVANLNNRYWDADIKIIWFRPGQTAHKPWIKYAIEPGRNEGDQHCHAGLDVGDIDQDGILDLAFSNGWYKAPKRLSEKWTWYPVAKNYGISNSSLRDLDGDRDLDLIVSAGHHGKGVYWYENNSDNQAGDWEMHTIDASVINPEGLAVVDMDGDGELDVIACELDFNHWDKQVHNIYLYENMGHSISWKRHNIAPDSFPSHQIQVVDINKDGKLDIISEGAGYKVVSYFENISRPISKKTLSNQFFLLLLW